MGGGGGGERGNTNRTAVHEGDSPTYFCKKKIANSVGTFCLLRICSSHACIIHYLSKIALPKSALVKLAS